MEAQEKYAPVVVFAYNRPEHLKRTLESLSKNTLAKDSLLFIFSDGARKVEDRKHVEEIRVYCQNITGFKNIRLTAHETNQGLAKSIINGVTEVIDKYQRAIVVEDDLAVSTNFLEYMNAALDFYNDKHEIFSISGYCPPISIPATYKEQVFLYYRINSWGWATWKNRWHKTDWLISDFSEFICSKTQRKEFNKGGEDCTPMLINQMNGKINSWAIRFNYAAYKNNSYTVYPVVSKVENKGADGSGVHVGKTSNYITPLDDAKTSIAFPEKLEINTVIARNFRQFFKRSIIRKTINFYKIHREILKAKIK